MKKLLIVLLLLVQPAEAAMTLDKIIVYLTDAPNSRDDILISNPDEAPLYLATEIYRVDNPGLENEARVRVTDPKEFRILVNPAKAVLAPGTRRRFRIMSLDTELDRERVYRVTFKPVVGEIKSDKPAVKILVAYQALVFVQPENGNYAFRLERRDNALQLTNTGNVNAQASNMEVCASEMSCTPLEFSERVYPGETESISLPENAAGIRDGFLRFTAVNNKQSSTVDLPLVP